MQTVITENITRALPGQIFGRTEPDVEPLSLESGSCGFGFGVIEGTDDENEAVLPSAAFTVAQVRGVTLRNTKLERLYPSTSDPVYEATSDKNPKMDVMRWGYVIVFPTTVVSRGDDVYMHHTANGSKLPGTFSNAVDATNNVDVSAKFKWFRGNGSVGQPAVLRVLITD